MNIRQWCIAIILAATAWAFLPSSSQAQYYVRGWGPGVGYGGWGYGGWAYTGWGHGVPGWGHPGGYFGPYPYYGGVQYPYPMSPFGYYNNAVNSSGPSVAYRQPMVTTTSYQSFYPSSGLASQSPPCVGCGAGPIQTAGALAPGSSRLVVNVPDSAQLFWNGQTQLAGAGASRRFIMRPTGTTQRIEARWTGADGKTVTQTRDVNVQPNETVTIDFTQPTDGINNGVNNNGVNNPVDGISTPERSGAR
jgi:hypothetical protein